MHSSILCKRPKYSTYYIEPEFSWNVQSGALILIIVRIKIMLNTFFHNSSFLLALVLNFHNNVIQKAVPIITWVEHKLSFLTVLWMD